MTPTNGQADAAAHVPAAAVLQAHPTSRVSAPTATQLTAIEMKDLISNLEVPFDPSVVEWRVTNTSKGGSPRGQVMPYADQRA